MSSMSYDLHQEISRRLLQDFGFKEKSGSGGKRWLRDGTCPSCKKRELYAFAESPWVLKCGRENNCGVVISVKDEYPEVFESWSDRFPATPSNPNEAADAYLKYARGLSLVKLNGIYTQESFFHPVLQQGSATVRFTLACGATWERIIDRPERFGKQKANFKGEYQGHWWQPPELDPSTQKELWLVEGIFNALALREHGINAVAIMSSGNYPEHELTALLARGVNDITLVWALDSDRAGRKGTLKFVERARKEGWLCKAAQIPQRGKNKADWNDLHLQEKLDAISLDTYRYHGALLIAETAAEKGLLMYQHTERHEFSFSHNKRLYWFKLDMGRYNKACEEIESSDAGYELSKEQIREKALRESGGIVQIANCSPHALYFQVNPITDESWYYFRVDFPHDGPSVKNTFTGGQLASAAEFKKRLLSMAAGAVFTGSSQQLDKIMLDQLYALRTVQTLDFIGYSREYGCYVFNNLAIKDGKVFPLNEEDFFEVGPLAIKSLLKSVDLHINTDSKAYNPRWLDQVSMAYGSKGVIATAFWLGSLFAEQIRAAQESYPFLEVVGEAGAGKTTLIEFLWKLVGRTGYEGFDPSKGSGPGRYRAMAQVGGLPVVLIESDRDAETAKSKRFDPDELKTAYNGRAIRTTGVKNGGTDTYEPPFRGSIVFAQNATVDASEAIISRIVHLYFDRGGQTKDSQAAADKLAKWPIEQASGFLLRALEREADIMELIKVMAPQYARQLQDQNQIRNIRVAKNHGQMMALIDALRLVAPMDDILYSMTQERIAIMAKERQAAVNADHPLVGQFWEAYEFLNRDDTGIKPILNHSAQPDEVAINLNHFVQVAEGQRQQIPGLLELKRLLPHSVSRKYAEQKTVRSAIWLDDKQNARSVRCWVFKIPTKQGE